MPKTRTEFWQNKVNRNKERDKRVKQELTSMGWHSITIWECELKPSKRERTLEALVYTLNRILLMNYGAKPYNTTEQETVAKAHKVAEANNEQ
jgi:DNA mismatch endonuclease (patch repair protein)